MWYTFLVRLKELAHAHVLNIMKGTKDVNIMKGTNLAESYATQTSAENRAYTFRNILTEAAEFRWQNCYFERTLCATSTNFSSGKILSRRPRIIRDQSAFCYNQCVHVNNYFVTVSVSLYTFFLCSVFST